MKLLWIIEIAACGFLAYWFLLRKPKPQALCSLRARQVKRVMPLIDPLLDEYDNLPNDLRSDLADCAPAFVRCMQQLNATMEMGDDH